MVKGQRTSPRKVSVRTQHTFCPRCTRENGRVQADCDGGHVAVLRVDGREAAAAHAVAVAAAVGRAWSTGIDEVGDFSCEKTD